MKALGYGICTKCNKKVAIRQDGTLYHHKRTTGLNADDFLEYICCENYKTTNFKPIGIIALPKKNEGRKAKRIPGWTPPPKYKITIRENYFSKYST